MATATLPISDYEWDGEEFIDDEGQPVDKHKLLLLLLLLIRFGSEKARETSQLLIFGRITIDVWYERMSEIVHDQAVASAAMAFGGVDNALTHEALIQAIIDEQQEFLQRFAAQIANGDVNYGLGLIARSQMYAEAAYSMYARFQRQQKQGAGAEWEKRILDANAEHCDDCLIAADEGWQPAGVLPDIGDSQCGVRCKCEMVYSASNTGPIDDSED